MPNYPSVNGVETSFCSIEFDIDGSKLQGVKSINYKDATEIGKVKGTSANVLSRTRGSNEPEGDIEMLKREWDALLPKLTRGGRIGYAEGTWPVSCTYSEPSEMFNTTTDKLVAVRFHSAEKSNSEGNDASMVKVSMSIMRIQWNGRYVALRDRR